MIEEIINEKKGKELVQKAVYKDIIIKQKSYKTSDNKVFNDKKDAEAHQIAIDTLSKIPTISTDKDKNLFLTDWGNFYYLKNEKELKFIIRSHLVSIGDKQYKIDKLPYIDFPQWFFIREESGGDYSDWTTVYLQDDILKIIEITRNIFEKIEILL